VFVFSGSEFMPFTTDRLDFSFSGTRVQLFHPERYDDEGDPCWDGWSECVECLSETFAPSYRGRPFVGLPSSRHWKDHEQVEHPTWKDGDFKDRDGEPLPWVPELPGCPDSRRIMQAYKAARSARFEFQDREYV
jgi:hypothetical protein